MEYPKKLNVRTVVPKAHTGGLAGLPNSKSETKKLGTCDMSVPLRLVGTKVGIVTDGTLI